MPDPTWIEFQGKTSAFQEMIKTTVDFHMKSYHRKIAYAAKLRKRLANPRSRKVNLNFNKMWYARAVSKAIINSAAADVAAAKALLKAEQVYLGMFTAKPQNGSNGGGMDLDG
jgi:hypothetical protein